ncbi:MAG TPA: short-chain dehydrogenase [Ruminococcaceae bacterium]|nr:short-chain dehydrogenase [Oscillospiraceae bacterium]
MNKVVIITGGSSGIGLCTAAALRDRGCKVYELSRRESEVEGITHLKCDITDESQIAAAVEQVMAENGRIDILINNAGFGISGAVEFTETKDAQRLFDVNFFGMVRMNRAILPLMRKQGYGHIVNLSSVAAAAPIPFQTYYSAGKAAINSYTMALSNEVKPFGITVAAVMPGDIKTGFTAARQKSIVGDDIYGGRISRSVAGMEKDEQTGMDPAKAGEFVAKVALRNDRKPLHTIGFAYKGAVFLTKVLPARWLNGLIGMIYAK